MPNKKKIRKQIYVGKVDGIRKYTSVYGYTQKEVNKKAAEIKRQLEQGLNVFTEKDTFAKWADEWLKNKEATVSNRDYQTYSGYRNQFKTLDNIQLIKIKPQQIQDIINQKAKYNDRTKRPTAKRTLKGYVNAIYGIFELAIENRVIQFNPAKNIKIPISAPKEERRALTDEEQRWILDTPHKAQKAAIIMMYSGLRRGELIPLLWTDIDLEKATISVNKSVIIDNNTITLKSGAKTASGERIINIPQVLVQYLTIWKNENVNSNNTNFLVFPDTNGNMYKGHRWRAMWDDYLFTLNNKYGKIINKNSIRKKTTVLTIPNITAHWLRHTFATMLYLAGVDVLTAKEQLGHTDVTTTLKIYTHLDKIHKQKNISKLDEYLNKKEHITENATVNSNNISV